MSNLVIPCIKYSMYKIVHVTLNILREYAGLDSLGELGWVGEEGIEWILGPSIKCVPVVSPSAKEKNKGDSLMQCYSCANAQGA